MSQFRVARRYAEALLREAAERNVLEAVGTDMLAVRDTVRSSREFQLFLRSPVIKHEKKAAVLGAMYEGRVQSITLDFLRLLAAKGRESALPDVIEEFFRLRDRMVGIVQVEVKAAAELSDDQARRLAGHFEGLTRKKVNINFHLDPQLKGGFIARVGDTVYDGSVRRQLELLRAGLSSADAGG